MNAKFLKAIAGVGSMAGLLAVGVLSTPVEARKDSQADYASCTAQLLDRNLGENLVSLACGTAFDPRALASCVANIEGNTEASAAVALDYCREVRRPREMASCVVDISSETTPSNLSIVLDSCRRSLLPDRYANCVLGVTSQSDLDTLDVMNDCIDATDRVEDFYPTFIPQ
ncbi:MAG: hypothetical protein J7641_06665 [Cyanobacteria bacterium SID2]|nr:hypothetical protein [Cyanobacteria bacterium SID2]MBP0003331.1 hypothetical protein [Cyanobacteria bacterium SBC]